MSPKIKTGSLNLRGSEPPGNAPDICYHCGESCEKSSIRKDDKHFCCQGCKLVYELLEEKDLCSYYDLNASPGETVKESGTAEKFAYLDDESLQQEIILHADGNIKSVLLTIPSVHCSSCVFVLEKLYKLDAGIMRSEVDFVRKQLSLKYDDEKTSLRKVAELLTRMGYEPQIQIGELKESAKSNADKSLYIKIGIAGFCLGNIMLFSLPDYLSIENEVEGYLRKLFGYLSLVLAVPVLLISARDYFSSAYTGLKQRLINIDVPIALGITTLFVRSSYEIISHTGSGYMDSFVALVFLLLLGKLFQQKTYDTLSFDRDYRSYFPVSVVRKRADREDTIPLTKLELGDRIVVRNQELVPADAILVRTDAFIDYSFVTGESIPVRKQAGDTIYAGGRQVGGAIELDVIKEVSQSYLTQLWNKDIYQKHLKSGLSSLTDSISKYFTIIVILIALSSSLYWIGSDPGKALNAFTAVLIIACPCALALSSPFALGTAMRIMGKNNFYLKNVNVIESLAKINSVVFDKTGTLTKSGEAEINFVPIDKNYCLEASEIGLIKSLVRHSSHPLSQRIYSFLEGTAAIPVLEYEEVPGAGLTGILENRRVKLGSADFAGIPGNSPEASSVFVSINDTCIGYFSISNTYRERLGSLLNELKKTYAISLLSGDKDWERKSFQQYFEPENLHFEQTPFNKLEYISDLQKSGSHVMMVGDGLNDAGSLKQSNVGISISEDKNAFSPACDAILEAGQFHKLPGILRLSRNAVFIIYISFIISFLYNILGMSFAVTGRLSPLISAILMPISSISVVAFATLSTNFMARKRGL